MSMYNLTRGLSVTAAVVRQPFVTLWGKPNGAPARKTIFLDYQFQGSILGVRLMFRNRHWSILAATVLTFLTSIAIIPLSAHVLEVRQTSFISTVQIEYSSTFNEDGYNGTSNILGALDIASAITGFQASPPPWMDLLFGYRPFTLPNAPRNGSVTVETAAYSALLDGNIINPDEYIIDSSSAVPTIPFADRGCTTKQFLNNGHSAAIFAYSYAEESCSIEAQYSRVGFLFGTYINSSQLGLADIRAVSCEPSYWQVNGSLTVSLRTAGEPLVSSFRNNSPWDSIRPVYWKAFEEDVVNYAVIDPTGYLSGNELGRKVYNYALATNPQNPFDPNTLKGGLKSVFTAVHAGLLKTDPFTAAPQTSFRATLTTPVYWLFVVTATAVVIMCFMILNLLCNI
jgi:hypothetical protein